MATALYVSAMALDIKSILEHCDIIAKSNDLNPTLRTNNIQTNYRKVISIHMTILK